MSEDVRKMSFYLSYLRKLVTPMKTVREILYVAKISILKQYICAREIQLEIQY